MFFWLYCGNVITCIKKINIMRKLFYIIILIANTIILGSEQAHSTEDSEPIEIVIIKDNTTVPVVKPMDMNTTFRGYYLNGYITIPLKKANANVFVSVVNLFAGEEYSEFIENAPNTISVAVPTTAGYYYLSISIDDSKYYGYYTIY